MSLFVSMLYDNSLPFTDRLLQNYDVMFEAYQR